MSSDDLPLSSADRILLQGLIAARSRLAWLFTALAATTALAFIAKAGVSGFAAGDGAAALFTLSGALGLGGVAWWFGWRPLQAMQADLLSGRKRLVHGRISWLERQPGPQGELVTTAVVAGSPDNAGEAPQDLRFVGRDDRMAEVMVGDQIVVELLPASGVILGGGRG